MSITLIAVLVASAAVAAAGIRAANARKPIKVRIKDQPRRR